MGCSCQRMEKIFFQRMEKIPSALPVTSQGSTKLCGKKFQLHSLKHCSFNPSARMYSDTCNSPWPPRTDKYPDTELPYLSAGQREELMGLPQFHTAAHLKSHSNHFTAYLIGSLIQATTRLIQHVIKG